MVDHLFFSSRLDLRASVPSIIIIIIYFAISFFFKVTGAPPTSTPRLQSTHTDINTQHHNLYINMSASFSSTLNSGQFDWLGKLGATREAIATLNDQPFVFYVLVAALVLLILEGVFIWYIHIATMKPEQKKKKEKKKDEKKPGGKPPAQR
ncbi:hypothetical protein F4803DRAFT_557089 [Xylaria telfairii]|nr:hypothetical protein F4803DRAFT_557089 [Xylaria telfairii]